MTDRHPLQTNRMRAITQAAFGSADVLQLREVPKPSPPAGEVLVGTDRGRDGQRVDGSLRLEPWEAVVVDVG